MKKETKWGVLFEEGGKKRFGSAFGRAIEYDIIPSNVLPGLYNVSFYKGVILAEDEPNWGNQPSKIELVCQCITVLANKYGKIQVYFCAYGLSEVFDEPITYLEVKEKVEQLQKMFMKNLDIY